MQRPLLPIFVSAGLIWAAYAAFVQFAPFSVSAGQNQNDTNLMRAQDYLAAPVQDTLLVGSSLTFRLPAAELGPHVANLAIAGGAPATGLALVEKAGTRPQLVLVEINLLARGPDLPMVGSLLRFPERGLRKYLRVFRTGYDPVNLAWRGAAVLMHKADVEPVPPPAVTRQLTDFQRQEKARAPDPAALARTLSQTASLVAALQARGIQIGFFEMPVDASLVHSPADTAVRRAAQLTFPPDRFCWLTLKLPQGAHTGDGIHLLAPDAALVARQVADQRATCLRR
jgi:hypothetical protein